MQLRQLELRRIALDLVTPFRTSFGTEQLRDILLLHVTADDADGWGECVAMAEPAYSAMSGSPVSTIANTSAAPSLALPDTQSMPSSSACRNGRSGARWLTTAWPSSW